MVMADKVMPIRSCRASDPMPRMEIPTEYGRAATRVMQRAC